MALFESGGTVGGRAGAQNSAGEFGQGLIGTAPPPVSVALPVYNGERYLQRSLDSLRAQTHVDFEIVIADNCSTDDTPDICTDAAAADERIRYIRRPTNVGSQNNHNRLVAETRGRYFAWAACDDEYEPGRLDRLHESLRDNPNAVLSLTSAQEIDEDSAPLHVWHNECRTDDPDPAARLRDFLTGNTTNLHIYGLIRRSVLERTGLLPPAHQGDRVLLAELLLHGTFVDVREPLLRHRLHSGRASETDPREFARAEVNRRPGQIDMPNVEELGWYLRSLRRAAGSPREFGRYLLAMRPWLRMNSVPMVRNVARYSVERAQQGRRRLADRVS